MLDKLTGLFSLSENEKKKFKKIEDALLERYPVGEDPWGLNVNKARKSLKKIFPIYKHYFKVRVFGKENVQDKPYMVVSNHTGQIAIDGMLLSTAFVMDVFPPRILRPMVERFFTALPFIAPWAAEGGSVLGDRTNALNLLRKGQSVMVFPEGVKGITKSTHEFYKMKPFTRGFYRMCAATGVEILPVGIVGAEEFFPYVYHPRMIQKALGLPGLPLSLNYFPLPSPVDIHIGEPISIPAGLDQDSQDKDIDEQVFQVEKAIKDLIEGGLETRRPFFANQVGKKKE